VRVPRFLEGKVWPTLRPASGTPPHAPRKTTFRLRPSSATLIHRRSSPSSSLNPGILDLIDRILVAESARRRAHAVDESMVLAGRRRKPAAELDALVGNRHGGAVGEREWMRRSTAFLRGRGRHAAALNWRLPGPCRGGRRE
jgi:hypothetical protein